MIKIEFNSKMSKKRGSLHTYVEMHKRQGDKQLYQK